ncbi:hypothetical protein ACQP2F_36040 [Actinoplanes sp. CA-030573]|uniref:hypothetical protein n=1 Tax=Actinoplanes sp. CA-030573 TaxID=3239898 RepID=UPI003D8C29CD
MISLVLAMVWTRRGQSLTLALLALFAVAAAVASPAYLAATDRAVAAGQIATATTAERSLSLSAVEDARVSDGGPQFTNLGAALVDLPGFDYVFSAQYPVIGLETDNVIASQVVFRQDVCAHLRIVAGRCLIGEGDVVLGAETARRLRLDAGDPITVTFAKFNNNDANPLYLADGTPKRLTVAGTYAVPAPDDGYWGEHGYFTAVPGRGPGEPLFLDRPTMDATDHGFTQMAIDGTAGPAALDVDRLGALRDGLAVLGESASKLGPAVQVNTDLPELLDRIDAGRRAARALVPVLAVPLVLLACFSIFLAVSYGAQGRQPELALVALRGSRWWTRWWLATGESLVAIVAGAIAGCVAGQLLVDAVAAARFPSVGAAAGWGSLRFAPYATVAALAAAVLAQRRQLASPVATLLRRNPAPVNGPRALAIEAVVVLLAVVSGVQLVLSGGTLTGLGLLAPAFLVLALALVAARALVPAVTSYAARSLTGGRLGPALAAFQLSRRPGAQRLFALLVATVAVAGYAACAIDVAARGRDVQAGLGIGADRVLTVQPVYRSQLLHAVRTIDPDGRFAMATVRLPSSAADESLGLAVDSPRLAAVATWPGGGPSAASVATALRPAAGPPVEFAGQDVTVVATTTGVTKGRELRLTLAVSSLAGLGDARVGLGELQPGRFTYQQRVPACRQGCRLDGIQVTVAATVTGVTGRVVIDSLAELKSAGKWRGGGLVVDANAPGGIPDGIWLRPDDAPTPLPAAYSGSAPPTGSVTGPSVTGSSVTGSSVTGPLVTGLDGKPMPVRLAGKVTAVPRLGEDAVLVDLEYADRLAADASPALGPQVWLNALAPPDILERVAAQGLTVVGDTRSAQVRRQLGEQGPALSVWFYVLAGGLAVLLGAGALVLAAAVDRARRVEDLTALRDQGVRRTVAGRATLWTYPTLVAIAAVAGLLVAMVAWALTGWALPLAGLDPPALPLPGWPRPLTVLATAVAVFLVLAAVAVATGRDLYRRIR